MEWICSGGNKKLGVLGALGSVVIFLCTVTIMPDGWAASAGGFPAMVGNVAFLMKDVVLLAVSFYLLKQDVSRIVSDESIDNLTSAWAGSQASIQELRYVDVVAHPCCRRLG
jgi:hypothetical protein